MNNLQIFNNEQFGQIRVVDRDGQPWFVGNDVAKALGYSRPRDAVKDHCKGGVKMALPSESGIQETTIIPEADVYRLILRSKLPQAEAFQDWIVEEVLPSIRKHGAYMTDSVIDGVARDPGSIIALAEAVVREHEMRVLAEERLNIFAPKKPFGIPSEVNGRPRMKPVSGYFRTTKTTVITEVTEHQRRLFDFNADRCGSSDLLPSFHSTT